MDNPDVIIVGAGPAGSSAAIKLAQAGVKTVLVDRGIPVGSKNLSGGVLWGNDLSDILPNWEEEAPVERYIINKKIGILSDEDATVIDMHFDSWNRSPHTGWSVLRAPFDEWLANQAKEAGVALLSGINIDALIEENGKIVGIMQGDEELRASVVIIAEGANSRLMLKHGLTHDPEMKRYPPKDYMIGVKDVLQLDREKLEERFLLEGNQGIAGEFIMGNLPHGVQAGGFFYTNKDTLSVGVVIHLDSLPEDPEKGSEIQSYKVIEYFKNHPYIRRLIKGGASLTEYGAKLIPEYGFDKFPEHSGNGYLVVGDAAGFVFSNGLVIQGINYAIKSGLLAAETIIEGKAKGELTSQVLLEYNKKLKNSYIYKDFKNFKKVKKMTKNPNLFQIYPKGINEGFKEILTERGLPKKHVLKTLLKNIRSSGASITTLVKDGLKARNL